MEENFIVTTSDMPVIENEVADTANNEDAPTAEEVTENNDSEQEQVDDTPQEEEAKPKPKNRAEKRIKAVIAEKHELARKLKEAEERLEAIESKGKEATAELDPDDFEDWDSYLDALVNAEDKEEEVIVNTKEPEAKKANDDLPQILEELEIKFEDSRDKYDDFDEVVTDTSVPLTQDMLRVIKESEEAGEIAYYLAKNKSLAARIAKITDPIKQALEIGKIEHQLLNPKKEEPKVVTQKTTKAPDPISPVGGSDEYQKTPEDMSFSEFEAYMNKQDSVGRRW